MYDIVILGSGPGGYVAAIRAAQLGRRVAIVEKAELGGVCLNWGCIPTKALLRSAHAYHDVVSAEQYGIEISGEVKPNFEKIIARSRGVSATMSKGVEFLLGKNKIDVVQGFGRLVSKGTIEVTNAQGDKQTITAQNIIIATGAHAKELPNIPIDEQKIISYRKALTLEEQPKSMVVIGSGAIGVELASFYHTIGTKVTIIEYLPNLVPLEDEEVSKYLERTFRKNKLAFMTNAAVTHVDTSGDQCHVTVQTTKGEVVIEAEKVLSAAGVAPNTEGIGLEELNIHTEKGKIIVDQYYRTSSEGIYAIGDVIPTPALAHVASAEAICCVEHICGLSPHPINYSIVPSCVYTSPEISSVGLREKEALEKGYEITVGKFPYTASGKATAMGNKDGFVKLIIDKNTEQLLGAHLIGTNVTEMIMEACVAMQTKFSAKELMAVIHPHPTLSEAMMEATAAALGEAIHTS